MISDDLEAETRFTPHPEALREGFASAMAASFGPLNGNWGVLMVYSQEARRFTHDDANFMEAIANILTIAAANDEASASCAVAKPTSDAWSSTLRTCS